MALVNSLFPIPLRRSRSVVVAAGLVEEHEELGTCHRDLLVMLASLRNDASHVHSERTGCLYNG